MSVEVEKRKIETIEISDSSEECNVEIKAEIEFEEEENANIQSDNCSDSGSPVLASKRRKKNKKPSFAITIDSSRLLDMIGEENFNLLCEERLKELKSTKIKKLSTQISSLSRQLSFQKTNVAKIKTVNKMLMKKNNDLDYCNRKLKENLSKAEQNFNEVTTSHSLRIQYYKSELAKPKICGHCLLSY